MPIIMLTARCEENERVRGLSVHVDDYVVKPFSMPELMLRVQALLRRARPERVATTLTVGDIDLDRVNRRVKRAGLAKIHLGPTEFRMLQYLMESLVAFSPALNCSTAFGECRRKSTTALSTLGSAGCERPSCRRTQEGPIRKCARRLFVQRKAWCRRMRRGATPRPRRIVFPCKFRTDLDLIRCEGRGVLPCLFARAKVSMQRIARHRENEEESTFPCEPLCWAATSKQADDTSSGAAFFMFLEHMPTARLTPMHNQLLHFWFCSSAPLQSADLRNAVEERRQSFSLTCSP